MNSPEFLRNAVAVLATILSGIALLLATLFRHSLLPVVRVKLDLTWKPSGLLHLKLTSENLSAVPAKVEDAYLQILERSQPLQETETLKDFIPFKEADFVEGSHSGWKEPIKLARPEAGRYIKAGEAIVVELLYRPSAAALAVHCDFRVLLKSKLAQRFYKHGLSFTTTAWGQAPSITN